MTKQEETWPPSCEVIPTVNSCDTVDTAISFNEKKKKAFVDFPSAFYIVFGIFLIISSTSLPLCHTVSPDSQVLSYLSSQDTVTECHMLQELYSLVYKKCAHIKTHTLL